MAYYPFAVEKGAIYTLVGPDGSKAVFNDPLDPYYVGMVTDLSGLGAAEVRESAQDLTEADGGSHGYFYFSRQPVVMTASVFGHASVLERNTRIDRARRASLALRGDSTLSWKPSTRTENLLINPTLTVNTTGVVSNTGGMAVNRLISPASSVPGWSGGAGTGFQWTGTISATNGYLNFYGAGAGTVGQLPNCVPVTPNKKYSVRGWTRLVTITSGAVSEFRILVWWYKADGTNSSTPSTQVAGQTSPPAGSTEYDWSGLVTPPSDAVGAIVAMYTTVTNPTTVEFRGSKFMMDEATAVEPYVDGDVAGSYWQGNQGASTSGNFVEMYTTMRRQQRFQESGNWVKEIQLPMVSEYATLFSTKQKTASAASGASAAAENRGNYVSYPILEWTGAGTNPRATTTVGGDFRTTGLTLAAGEVVQFDMLNHTGVFTAGARNTQSANRYIDFATTQWLGLPGAATTNVTNVTGSGTMRVLWRDVWA